MTNVPTLLAQSPAPTGAAKPRLSTSPGPQQNSSLLNAKDDLQAGKETGLDNHPEFQLPVSIATPVKPAPFDGQKFTSMPSVSLRLPELNALVSEGYLPGGPVEDGELSLELHQPSLDTVALEQSLSSPDDVPGPQADQAALTLQSTALPFDAMGSTTPQNRLQGAQLRSAETELVPGFRQPALLSAAGGNVAGAAILDSDLVHVKSSSEPLSRLQQEKLGRGLGRIPEFTSEMGRLHQVSSGRMQNHHSMTSGGAVEVPVTTATGQDAGTQVENQAGLKVTVLHQETHLGSAAREGARNADLILGLRAENAKSVHQQFAPLDQRANEMAPARILHLHLEPVRLGGVIVKMSMKGEALSVQIEPELQQTAAMLRNDSSALKTILQAAGVTAETVSVQVTDPDPNASDDELRSEGQNSRQGDFAQHGNTHRREEHTVANAGRDGDADQGPNDEHKDAVLSGSGNELFL